MSEDECYKGTLYEIEPKHGETVQDLTKRMLEEMGIEIENFYHGDYLDCFSDKCQDDFIVIKNKIYRYTRTKIDAYDSVYEASRDSNGDIDFMVKYHNGGCGFSEAISEALERNIKRMDEE